MVRILFQRSPIVAALIAVSLLAACAGETVVTRPGPMQFTPDDDEPEDGGLDIAGFGQLPGTTAPRPLSLAPKSQDDVEIRFATLGVHHTAVVGVDAANPAADDSGFSPYAADTVKLGPRWRLAGGARWDRPAADPANGGLLGIDTEPRSRAAVVYASPSFGSYYAAYGNTLDPAPTPLHVAAERDPAQLSVKPADGQIYETGGKWQLFGKKLTLRGAAFHTHQAGPPSEADLAAVQELRRVNGLELNAVARVTPRWRLHAGYGLLDSEVIASADAAAVGKKLADTAPQTLKLWTSYTLDPLQRLTVGGGTRYVDKRMTDETNTSSVPDYVVFDAAVRYAVSDQVGLQLDLINLADARWYDSAWDTAHADEARSGKLTGKVQF